MIKRTAVAIAICALSLAAADDAPAWLKNVALTVPPKYDAKVKAVVLLDESRVNVEEGGKITTTRFRAVPAIEREPSSAALSSIARWLAVSVVPAAGARTGLGKTFENWQDVSRWLAELADPQTTASPELAEKARSLTSGAKSDFARIE